VPRECYCVLGGNGSQGIPASVPEVRRLLEVVLPPVTWTPEQAIAWFHQQREPKAEAQRCHRQRWLREHPHDPG